MLILVICYWLCRLQTLKSIWPACLVVAVLALNLVTSDVAAVAGLLMTGLTVWLVSLTATLLPRFWLPDFFPVFYCQHLVGLGVLAIY